MHTTRVGVEQEEYICLHNGDYSGNVEILEVDEEGSTSTKIGSIPFEVMKELVGQWIIDETISALEQTKGVDIFKKPHML